jgi:hypothetical protein
MDPEVEPPRNPPVAGAVARRAQILSAVTCRGHVEHNLGDPASEALYARIVAWLDTCNLMEFLEPEERTVLLAPMGSLTSEQQLASIWKVEGAAVLAWALGKYPLPPHDVKVEPFKVAETLGFLWDEAAQYVRYAQLRGRTELKAYRELVHAIHGRLREAEQRPQRDDFGGSIQSAWLRALGLSRASPLTEGDLAIDGQPLKRVDPSLRRTVEEINHERHRAAIWLVGQQEGYWSLSVDTP